MNKNDKAKDLLLSGISSLIMGFILAFIFSTLGWESGIFVLFARGFLMVGFVNTVLGIISMMFSQN